MFKYEENRLKTGTYLKKIIEKNYSSHRQFCKDYLEMKGIEATNEELGKMSTRLSHIIHGRKAIQTYDLPYFTELLHVSCEEILSCGKTFMPISQHITNYQIALSKDPQIWQKYINRKDKLILNSDEYNKTILDYAIEFKNYAFIKYLMDNKYIWFVDHSQNNFSDHILGYGAGTSIKRRSIGEIDSALGIDLKFHSEDKKLRQKIIALAISNNDFITLQSLKARENPALHQLCIHGYNTPLHGHDYYEEDVIEAIVHADEKTLSYFIEEFEITDQQNRQHSFLYPFLKEVIEELIKNKSPYIQPVMQKAIKHNKKTYQILQAMINDYAKQIIDHTSKWLLSNNEDIIRQTMAYYSFYEEDGLLSYMSIKAKHDYHKICTNIIHCDVTSHDLMISSLIKELNRTYNDIKNIQPIIKQ